MISPSITASSTSSAIGANSGNHVDIVVRFRL
jgi:hypothetical protein